MNDREKLKAALSATEMAFEAHRRIVDNEANEAARAARLTITTKHASETERLSQARAEASRALRDHIDATSTHEWEGCRVKRTIYHCDWRGQSMLDRAPKTVEFGIVEVRRSESEFPANLAGYSLPSLGEAFVRLLKKDGKAGSKIAKLSGGFGPKWELAEPASGMETR